MGLFKKHTIEQIVSVTGLGRETISSIDLYAKKLSKSINKLAMRFPQKYRIFLQDWLETYWP